MKKKKIEEYRQLSKEQLEEKIVELRAELRKEYATISSGSRPEKPAKIRNLKREIARILTILNQKFATDSPGSVLKTGAKSVAMKK